MLRISVLRLCLPGFIKAPSWSDRMALIRLGNMLVRSFVKVLPADRAQALAVGAADGINRDLDQQVFPDQWRQVHVSILRDEQARIRNRALVKGIQLTEGSFQ